MKWMRPSINWIDLVLIGLILMRLGSQVVAGTAESSPTAPEPDPAGPSTNLTAEIDTVETINSSSSFSSSLDGVSVDDVQQFHPVSVLPSDYRTGRLSSSAETVGGDDGVEAESSDHPSSVEGSVGEVWAKIRHLHQKVRLKEPSNQQEVDEPHHESLSQEWDYLEDSTGPTAPSVDDKKAASVAASGTGQMKGSSSTKANSLPSNSNGVSKARSNRVKTNTTGTAKPFRILASGSRKSKLLAATAGGASVNMVQPIRTSSNRLPETKNQIQEATVSDTLKSITENPVEQPPINPPRPVVPRSFLSSEPSTGAPKLENKYVAMNEVRLPTPDSMSDSITSISEPADSLELYDSSDADSPDANSLDDPSTYDQMNKPNLDIMTKFLRIVESQSLLGDNCTAGTDFNLGEGVVDRYAQERFRLVAEVAVNRANWLTRLWKYASKEVLESEYLLHDNLLSMIEMDEDIFAAGNCYDKYTIDFSYPTRLD